jgi:hypothetical protein
MRLGVPVAPDAHQARPPAAADQGVGVGVGVAGGSRAAALGRPVVADSHHEARSADAEEDHRVAAEKRGAAEVAEEDRGPNDAAAPGWTWQEAEHVLLLLAVFLQPPNRPARARSAGEPVHHSANPPTLHPTQPPERRPVAATASGNERGGPELAEEQSGGASHGGIGDWGFLDRRM